MVRVSGAVRLRNHSLEGAVRLERLVRVRVRVRVRARARIRVRVTVTVTVRVRARARARARVGRLHPHHRLRLVGVACGVAVRRRVASVEEA